MSAVSEKYRISVFLKTYVLFVYLMTSARSSNAGACVNAREYLRQRRQRHSVWNARVITEAVHDIGVSCVTEEK